MWGWAALRKDSTRFPNFTQAETGAMWVEMGIKGTDVGGSNKVVLANSVTWASWAEILDSVHSSGVGQGSASSVHWPKGRLKGGYTK